MSVKLNVVTIQDFDKIKSEVTRIFIPTTTQGWILARYTGPTTVAFQTSSSGTAEDLLPHLEDNQIQYALIRLPPNEEGISKDIFLTWAGPKVSKIERGKKSEHLSDVKSVLGPSHTDLTALTRQRFSTQTLWELSLPSSGTHVLKPLDEVDDRQVTQATLEADARSRQQTEERLKQAAAENIKKKAPEISASAPASGDSEKLSVVTLLAPNTIRKAVALLLERSTPSGWVIVGYSGNTNNIQLVAHGFAGVQEMSEHLKDDQIQYALLRLPADPTTKDIFLNWVGCKVSKIQQGKKVEHLADLKSVLGPAHTDLTILTRNGFTDQKVRELSDPSSGTHILKADQ